jgi:hypothetical protein
MRYLKCNLISREDGILVGCEGKIGHFNGDFVG